MYSTLLCGWGMIRNIGSVKQAGGYRAAEVAAAATELPQAGAEVARGAAARERQHCSDAKIL